MAESSPTFLDYLKQIPFGASVGPKSHLGQPQTMSFAQLEGAAKAYRDRKQASSDLDAVGRLLGYPQIAELQTDEMKAQAIKLAPHFPIGRERINALLSPLAAPETYSFFPSQGTSVPPPPDVQGPPAKTGGGLPPGIELYADMLSQLPAKDALGVMTKKGSPMAALFGGGEPTSSVSSVKQYYQSIYPEGSRARRIIDGMPLDIDSDNARLWISDAEAAAREDRSEERTVRRESRRDALTSERNLRATRQAALEKIYAIPNLDNQSRARYASMIRQHANEDDVWDVVNQAYGLAPEFKRMAPDVAAKDLTEVMRGIETMRNRRAAGDTLTNALVASYIPPEKQSPALRKMLEGGTDITDPETQKQTIGAMLDYARTSLLPHVSQEEQPSYYQRLSALHQGVMGQPLPPFTPLAPVDASARAPHIRDQQIRALAYQTAERYGVDPTLVEAVIGRESSGNPRAVSPKQAKGVMQLIDATASRYGVRDVFDPAQNIDGGVRYLRDLSQRYGGDKARVLAAYNAGEGAVDKYGGIPPFPETQAYVKNVLADYDRLSRGADMAAPPRLAATDPASVAAKPASPQMSKQAQQALFEQDDDTRDAIAYTNSVRAQMGKSPLTMAQAKQIAQANRSPAAPGAAGEGRVLARAPMGGVATPQPDIGVPGAPERLSAAPQISIGKTAKHVRAMATRLASGSLSKEAAQGELETIFAGTGVDVTMFREPESLQVLAEELEAEAGREESATREIQNWLKSTRESVKEGRLSRKDALQQIREVFHVDEAQARAYLAEG